MLDYKDILNKHYVLKLSAREISRQTGMSKSGVLKFIHAFEKCEELDYPYIPVLGIHATQEDADTVKTKEVNGIKIAFLDYTYGTNNSGLGDGYDYMLDIFDKDKITSMIQKAKQVSDCIIFVAHWGTEDETMPNEFEKQWAAFLMQQGVDVIIGGHPHVLQPYGQKYLQES